MLYVAYGSNINPDQMKHRCPKAQVIGTGVIHNWKLDFHGTDGNGYATITQATGNTVPVVLWEMSKADEAIMDVYEGYPKSYFKKKIAVYVGDQKKFGTVYIMNEARRVARPARKYANTIRHGYLHFGLDVEYFNDALRRNSEDFYYDDLLEVREFKPTKTSFVFNGKKSKSKKKKGSSKIKARDVKVFKDPFEYEGVPADLASYMKKEFPDDPNWNSIYGYDDDIDADLPDFKRTKPSLDYYDMKLK